MTTRRERLEAKVARREEWAEKRRQKADALRNVTPASIRHDWAFITQPGHIPERARMNARDERAHEHGKVAAHHESRAAGLAAQLDRTIFSDDSDAVQELQRRADENEAKAVRMATVNKLFRKGDAAGLAALGIDLERLRAMVDKMPSYDRAPHASWELSNLRARIRTDRKRIEEVRERQQRAQAAEAAPAGFTIEGEDYVRITFAEKPERETLEALRAAGFHWGGGSWTGHRSQLPEALAAEAAQ